jgi:hypothetical protein
MNTPPCSIGPVVMPPSITLDGMALSFYSVVNSPLCILLNVRIVGEKEIETVVEGCSHALI